jgi:hypothetical protein
MQIKVNTKAKKEGSGAGGNFTIKLDGNPSLEKIWADYQKLEKDAAAGKFDVEGKSLTIPREEIVRVGLLAIRESLMEELAEEKKKTAKK